jgi:hypothetical protein
MGVRMSVPSTDYKLHAQLRVRVISKKKSVRHGDAIRVEMTLESRPVPAVAKYFLSAAFIRDLNGAIMFRDADLPNDIGLTIPAGVLTDVGWIVKDQKGGVLSNNKMRVSFTVTVQTARRDNSPYPLTDVCGFMAACMSRHFSAGSIPVNSRALNLDDWAYITAITLHV